LSSIKVLLALNDVNEVLV